MNETIITWPDSKPKDLVKSTLRAHVLKLAHAMMSKKSVYVNGAQLEFCEGVDMYDWNTLYEVIILSISPTEVLVETPNMLRVRKSVGPFEVHLKNK